MLKLGLHPDTVTLLGLAGHAGAAYLAAIGKMSWAGVVILLTAPLDALDGAMARLKGNASKFGAFLDSVTDRYAEMFIFGGLLLYYIHLEDTLGCILVYLSVAGSIMVSYTRARAEALGFTAKIGIFSRVERYLVLIPALLFQIPRIGLWILAIFTNFTAIQRVIHVRRQAIAEWRGVDPVSK